MNMDKFLEFYNTHRGGFNGAAAGVALAISFLIFGFFRTIFVAIFGGVGYYIGKKVSEDKDYIKNLLDRILPPGTYR